MFSSNNTLSSDKYVAKLGKNLNSDCQAAKAL